MALLLFLLACGEAAHQVGPSVGATGALPERLIDCPASPNCVSSQGDDDEHHIAALALGGDPELLRPRLVAAREAMPHTRIERAEGPYIHATATSALFRFVDDVELLIGPEVVEVRSASRVGKSDLGVNRKRVEALREALR